MSGYSDDPRDYDRDDRRDGSRDERTVAVARGAVAAPAVFIILNALVGLVIAAAGASLAVQPELLTQLSRNLVANQPQGPDRQKLEDQIDEQERVIQQNRAAIQIQNAVQVGVLAVGNLIALVGGLAMRSLGSHGLSMAGAVVSIVPVVTGCCCTGTVFGIWALIVLMRSDVSAGFAARRRLAAPPPDAY